MDALTERTARIDGAPYEGPLDISGRSAEAVLNLATLARGREPPPVGLASVLAAQDEILRRCATVPADESCIGPTVGRKRLEILLTLAVGAKTTIPPASELTWSYRGNLDAPLAYSIPTPHGFHRVAWSPANDGTQAQRFEGDERTPWEGAVVIARVASGWVEGRGVACEPIEGGASRNNDPLPLAYRCFAESAGRRRWVRDDAPIFWELRGTEGRAFRLAYRAADLAASMARPHFDPPIVVVDDVRDEIDAENARAVAEDRVATLEDTVGWRLQANRPVSFPVWARARWEALERAGWEREASDEVGQTTPSGLLYVLRPFRARPYADITWRGRRSYEEQRIGAASELRRAAAEVRERCPSVAASDEARLPPADYEGAARTESNGSVRVLGYGWSGSGMDGAGVWTTCVVDLATCRARTLFTGVDSNVTPYARYFAWENHPDAPSPASLASHDAISFHGVWETTFPDGPRTRGHQPSWAMTPSCRPRLRPGTRHIQAGPWRPGRPGRIPARLVPDAPPQRTGTATTSSGIFMRGLEPERILRAGRYEFYSTPRFRYGGEIVATYDAAEDRHRFLVDAKNGRFSGNIQLHDLVGDTLIFSITPDPRPDWDHMAMLFVMDLRRGRAVDIDGNWLVSPNAPMNAELDDTGEDVPQRGEYDSPHLGLSFLTGAVPPAVAALERVGQFGQRRECTRSAPLSQLTRGL